MDKFCSDGYMIQPCNWYADASYLNKVSEQMLWEESKVWHDTVARRNRCCLLFSYTFFWLVCFSATYFPTYEKNHAYQWSAFFIVIMVVCVKFSQTSPYIFLDMRSKLCYLHVHFRNPATFLHAYTCLPLAYATRQAAGAVLQDVADSGVLFAILMSRHKVGSLLNFTLIISWHSITYRRSNVGSQSCRCSESFSSPWWYAATCQLCNVLRIF